MLLPPPTSTLFPYTTLFRSASKITCRRSDVMSKGKKRSGARPGRFLPLDITSLDRKSGSAGMPRPISYAVFCLKKKIDIDHQPVSSNGVDTPLELGDHGGIS